MKEGTDTRISLVPDGTVGQDFMILLLMALCMLKLATVQRPPATLAFEKNVALFKRDEK